MSDVLNTLLTRGSPLNFLSLFRPTPTRRAAQPRTIEELQSELRGVESSAQRRLDVVDPFVRGLAEQGVLDLPARFAGNAPPLEQITASINLADFRDRIKDDIKRKMGIAVATRPQGDITTPTTTLRKTFGLAQRLLRGESTQRRPLTAAQKQSAIDVKKRARAEKKAEDRAATLSKAQAGQVQTLFAGRFADIPKATLSTRERLGN